MVRDDDRVASNVCDCVVSVCDPEYCNDPVARLRDKDTSSDLVTDDVSWISRVTVVALVEISRLQLAERVTEAVPLCSNDSDAEVPVADAVHCCDAVRPLEVADTSRLTRSEVDEVAITFTVRDGVAPVDAAERLRLPPSTLSDRVAVDSAVGTVVGVVNDAVRVALSAILKLLLAEPSIDLEAESDCSCDGNADRDGVVVWLAETSHDSVRESDESCEGITLELLMEDATKVD